ncbi:hypothetical protein BEN71_15625 [Acinetobacter wuhouensis]|uniref:hypothetical protein n=1 Tax=Acinetobacter wuhouensis TaxID=1879050 RepID=UPI00083B4677|nr:hypothetical protein [Acinetobacter wuhouensis]AXQ23415.1 hypothetical protein BEN71_15625 [Acinetobacter wuhouensis]
MENKKLGVGMEKILDSNKNEWDAKETVLAYNYLGENNNIENIKKLDTLVAKNNLGARLVKYKLEQDSLMKNNEPVDLYYNEIYQLGISGQPLAASYAATDISEVSEIQESKLNYLDIIKIQKKLLETGIKGGVLANFSFYLSLLTMGEDEAKKNNDNWLINKKIISGLNLSKKDNSNLFNTSLFLAKKGYDISPIYLMQFYKDGIGVDKDIVEACAWAQLVPKYINDNDVKIYKLNLVNLIKSEKDKELCLNKSEMYKKNILGANYDEWYKEFGISYNYEAEKILEQEGIKF